MTFWSRDRGIANADDGVPRTASGSSGFQCDRDVLSGTLDRLLAARRTQVGGAGLAFFFIELRRSDRAQALAGIASARAAIEIICDRVATLLNPGDLFALNGVDELLLVLPAVDNPGRAVAAASQLVLSLSRPMDELSTPTSVRPAIGCAIYPEHGDDAEALITAADLASRAARDLRDGYRIAVRSRRAAGNHHLSADLRSALDGNQLQVWLQPQLNLRTGQFDAAEALLRWPRPEGQPPVSPIVAIELAETQGLMPQLTAFVLNTVLRHSATFRRRGMDLRIAINLSASMLMDDKFPSEVASQLTVWEVAPDRLTIEVTEGTLMQDVERSIDTLHALKEIGCHVSLDDFGTGYSSFAWLRRMPLDELKIDQAFVRHLSVLADGTRNPQRDGDLRIVRSIIDIAHNFELHAVAEGVEDAETLDMLRGLGCDIIQGYFTGRPMPIPKLEAWWRERRPASAA